eukprot:CAMPEP_0204028698 /NCGR_PEP_ID=MMETSP0360-20130528/52849_1 /ASSEMBLY_ACC=CAM_ASM_000342 /TAXON_ID=268821 /ORGANISM="Scrippsiella Hangoei, Strain SHTV-5" /LENGTH=50 /DNA_ID=CAMNT_0050972563 /DNA_START=40 /DNA_END=188 /DNA_ORIENTATION=-
MATCFDRSLPPRPTHRNTAAIMASTTAELAATADPTNHLGTSASVCASGG